MHCADNTGAGFFYVTVGENEAADTAKEKKEGTIDPLSIFDTKMEVLVPYANGSLKIFIFLKIPHRITFLTLRQRCR